MKGGITTMTLDFTKNREFVEDVYRYFNDSRICSLAGQLSDPNYEIVYKALSNSGIKEYAPFFNLAINRTFYVYNKNEARFYCLTLDEDDIKTICERFFIENIDPIYSRGPFKVSRTDSRIIESDNPLAMYIGIATTVTKDHKEDDGTVTAVTTVVKRPFYFDLSKDTLASVIDQYGKLFSLYYEICDPSDFKSTADERSNVIKQMCDTLTNNFMNSYKDNSTIETMEYMAAKEYYGTHKGNPKYSGIFGR